MSEKKIPLWIDTDTGVDDAVMLMCASELEELDIKGVSAVAGNVEEEKTFRNARAVMSLCGKEDIKVYPGAKTPLMIPLETAAHVHGDDGLGGAIIPDSKACFVSNFSFISKDVFSVLASSDQVFSFYYCINIKNGV